MRILEKHTSIVIHLITFVYILLFVYAAMTKFLDFENFRVQLGQSPLLSAFAGPISYIVPISELIIAGFLCFEKFKIFALYAAFSLMAMFTVYIIIILNFSPFVPCSCGGILEKMTWTQHLIFNYIFVFLGATGIWSISRIIGVTRKKIILTILILVVGSSAIIAVLFLLSEDMIHHRNNFVRRFPHHPVTLIKSINIMYDSYYIAGEGAGNVYLGSKTAPLNVLVADSMLQKVKEHTITLPDHNYLFSSIKISVKEPYFYVWDGSAALIFRGNVADWIAEVYSEETVYFTAFEPISKNRIAFRAISSETKENVLGVLSPTKAPQVFLNSVLDKQLDGIFDTNGTLLYNQKHQKLVYTYSFKNEYLLTDTLLLTKTVHHTIDTNSRVRIRTKYNSSKNLTTLSTPAYVVNSTSRTYDDYLFVNSLVIGKYESIEMWKEASIIDVYNFTSDRYEFSFYLYDIKENKVTDYIINKDKAFVLTGQYLSSYRLKKTFYK